MNPIPDSSDTELWTVRTTVDQRYGKEVDLQLADSELRLDPDLPALTTRPTIFWPERGANFVIFKVGDSRYRCQFFYSDREHLAAVARPTTMRRSARRRCSKYRPIESAIAG